MFSKSSLRSGCVRAARTLVSSCVVGTGRAIEVRTNGIRAAVNAAVRTTGIRAASSRSQAAVLSLGLCVMLLAACQNPVSPIDSEQSAAESESLTGLDVAANKAAIGDAAVLLFEDPTTQVGASQLVRTPNGVNYKLSTSGLQPGHAYTLWIVIFNNTEDCGNGTPGFSLCGPNDVVNDEARPDMMYAGGHVAGGSGKATFAGRRKANDLSGSINGPVGVPAYGLEDPINAEIHLVVHDHGPKMAAYMPDMIKTVDGGCMDAGIPFEGAESPWNLHEGFGRRGTNTCASTQFAVHNPDAL